MSGHRRVRVLAKEQCRTGLTSPGSVLAPTVQCFNTVDVHVYPGSKSSPVPGDCHVHPLVERKTVIRRIYINVGGRIPHVKTQVPGIINRIGEYEPFI